MQGIQAQRRVIEATVRFGFIREVKLGEMNRRDNNPPIKLEGEDAIDYGIVATYMNKRGKL